MNLNFISAFPLEMSRNEPEYRMSENAFLIGNSDSIFIIQLNNQPVTDSQWRKVVEAEYLVQIQKRACQQDRQSTQTGHQGPPRRHAENPRRRLGHSFLQQAESTNPSEE
jgi:hypothetical protein